MAGADLRTGGLDKADHALAATLGGAAADLPPPEQVEAFGAPFDRFGGADLVLLGEATHGTSEFYRARAAISRHLIQNHGFNIVAVEADWPDAARIDRYVRHGRPEVEEQQAFARFPSWMWRNREVEEFVHWLRQENEHRRPQDRVEFRGLDISACPLPSRRCCPILTGWTARRPAEPATAMAVSRPGRTARQPMAAMR